MPVPHGSPDSVTYAGSMPFMTPRTPRSPEDNRAVLGTGGFPHIKSRLAATRGDKAKQSGALGRVGNPFNGALEDKDQLKELLKLAQTHGQTSLGSRESLLSFSRSGDTPPTIPDHLTVAREKSKIHYEGIHRAAVALSEKERANTYIDLLRVDEPPAPPSDTSGTRNKEKPRAVVLDPTRELASHARVRSEVLERVDHSFMKTCMGIANDYKMRKKDAEMASKADARRLDQVPTSYAAWKKLDEGRQVKVARFLQLTNDQKDADLANRQWNRDDAMTLYKEYMDQPEFKADVTKLLAKRVTTDPRRRPTVSSTPNPHA
ncbi:unnamed protein product [Rhizoctonia solani]|uniref:Uncharacterized protein n=1 Tax=Rhizoctonia solani TaxID=456999 RepID=A0A8H3BF73_9AGAM|nr:unnamed protein product [Rhizoctonia solani]CAE6513858.1 unnamed protein product [Rhizoctonia solani]